ncbi:MAG: sulfurtransferase-like selenium metabolism protein YedF, partial [Bacteroidales bacterium]|nr:sulfurtransferase-like selenium metabolism protein YedF [Bacteroidales bacterium]
PLIKTRQGLTEADSEETVRIIIDNPASLNNVKRYLTDNKLVFTVEEEEGAAFVTVRGKTEAETEAKAKAKTKIEVEAEVKVKGKIELKGNPEDYCSTSGIQPSDRRNTVIAVTSDIMGSGDVELGARLMVTFFRMLALTEPAPDSIVFYNSGVKLTVTGSPVEGYIRDFISKGTGIYICTTCINHFSLQDQITVGNFSDMYQIINLMKDADHIIRP